MFPLQSWVKMILPDLSQEVCSAHEQTGSTGHRARQYRRSGAERSVAGWALLRETSPTCAENWQTLGGLGSLSGNKCSLLTSEKSAAAAAFYSPCRKRSVLYNRTYLPPFNSQKWEVQSIGKMKGLTGGGTSILYTGHCSSLLDKSGVRWHGQQGTRLNCLS